MSINFKTIYLFTLIFFGLYIFFTNIQSLNLKKNIIFSEPKTEEIQKKKIFDVAKKKAPNSIAPNSIDNSVTNLNEEIFTVKKGQTFSEILDNFIFKFDKFEIINSVNNKFDLKSLKVNQKISFFSDEDQIIQNLVLANFDFDLKSLIKLNILDQYAFLKNCKYINFTWYICIQVL